MLDFYASRVHLLFTGVYGDHLDNNDGAHHDESVADDDM